MLILLGAWAAIVPFAGPAFGYPMPAGSHIGAWIWSASHLELHLVPGIATILGGMLLLLSRHRQVAAGGATLAVVGGAWQALGPVFSPAFSSSGGGMGMKMGIHPSTFMTVVTPLGYHYGTGVVEVLLAALALGWLAASRRAATPGFQQALDHTQVLEEPAREERKVVKTG
ncbi:MAG TPA: hypothetical protein VKU88_10615 [Acidimicrobiales bacterium]|nr:hypothetical protein [Acidimicrobiales bacterium]